MFIFVNGYLSGFLNLTLRDGNRMQLVIKLVSQIISVLLLDVSHPSYESNLNSSIYLDFSFLQSNFSLAQHLNE